MDLDLSDFLPDGIGFYTGRPPVRHHSSRNKSNEYGWKCKPDSVDSVCTLLWATISLEACAICIQKLPE